MLADALTGYHEFPSADEAESWAEIYYPDLCGDRRGNNPDYMRLFFYGGNCYRRYNKMLRYGWECSEDTMREVLELTDILGKYELPEPVVAYRYTHKRDMKRLCMGKRLRPGLRFADNAFFSTSLVISSLDKFQKQYNCNCLLKLYLPKGIHGAYLSLRGTPSRLNEQELLLQRNTQFEIITIHRFRRPMVIECKAIINATSEV